MELHKAKVAVECEASCDECEKEKKEHGDTSGDIICFTFSFRRRGMMPETSTAMLDIKLNDHTLMKTHAASSSVFHMFIAQICIPNSGENKNDCMTFFKF